MVIAGDLFDGDWRDMNTGLYFARAMGRLHQAGIPAFLLAGNHDAASVISRTIPWPPNVRLFGSRRPETHRLAEEGDGLVLDELVAACAADRASGAAASATTLRSKLAELNDAVGEAATVHGEARKVSQSLDTQEGSAADAAAEAEQARAELEVLSEHYILKRAQAIVLKWAIERYRKRNQDPLLLRRANSSPS